MDLRTEKDFVHEALFCFEPLARSELRHGRLARTEAIAAVRSALAQSATSSAGDRAADSSGRRAEEPYSPLSMAEVLL
jgi:hypothetical protein